MLSLLLPLSKGKALGWAIFSSLLTIGLMALNAGSCIAFGLVPALAFGGIWFAMYRRDRKFAEAGKRLPAQTTQQLPEKPLMTTPESSWFGVPPPPPDRRLS